MTLSLGAGVDNTAEMRVAARLTEESIPTAHGILRSTEGYRNRNPLFTYSRHVGYRSKHQTNDFLRLRLASLTST
jgi:hypothetical protein